MKCVGIIWNCSLPFENEIMDIIKYNSNITEAFSLDLGKFYDDFVRKIYETDTIADWKVNEKIKHMHGFGTAIKVVYFDIDVSETFYNPYKKANVFCKLELLKSLIRTICMSKIQHYFFDISFHCSDSESEYRSDFSVINEFINKLNE